MSAFALATLVFAGFALWRAASRPTAPQLVLRGRGGDLPLVATRSADGPLHLSWPGTPQTVAYHVELADSRGHTLSRSVPKPVLDVPSFELDGRGDVSVTVESELASGDRASRATTLRFPRPAPTTP